MYLASQAPELKLNDKIVAFPSSHAKRVDRISEESLGRNIPSFISVLAVCLNYSTTFPFSKLNKFAFFPEQTNPHLLL